MARGPWFGRPNLDAWSFHSGPVNADGLASAPAQSPPARLRVPAASLRQPTLGGASPATVMGLLNDDRSDGKVTNRFLLRSSSGSCSEMMRRGDGAPEEGGPREAG